ncbi:MAG TPA: acetylornithine deacetylase [Stellaceae bacterium]|jgi:acetylornithine deacetylase|nr:acetylornithine deacetylase [Stellaceae bacterium]
MNTVAIDSVEMVRRLVGFDTTSRGSNLALIEFARDYLDHYGVKSELIFDETGNKANLYATIGPAGVGGIMLSGHTDVVPVDGQEWHSDPFTVLAKDDRLFGRGTADMKSFIAVVLALLPTIAARRLRVPIHLAFSYDEEVGCRGARRLVAAIGQRPDRPLLCVVGEPTMMQPVTGHKGKRSFRCQVHGFECHSALTHLGVNAIEAAAEMVAELKAMARKKREFGPFDPAYTPAYTTIQTGVIHGGTALNIVPKECSFDFEFRLLPGDDPEAGIAELRAFAAERLLPDMRAVRSEAAIAFEELSAFPGLDTPDDAEITRLVASLTGVNGTGKVAFGTEGGLFQQAGIATIVCGPGSIEQAHKPDEFVDLDQIARCEKFIGRLFDWAAG